MYEDLKNKIQSIAGSEYLYFDTPLKIKMSPHTMPLLFWAVCISPAGRVYVMDSNSEWAEVEEKDSVIVSTLYQRIQIVHAKTCNHATA